MLEQEMASIIKFILEKAGSPPPYYNEVPEGFLLPSVYFPSPEVTSDGDTFRTYALKYAWFINFFHVDKASAYNLAFPVLTAIRKARNLIPLIGVDGKPTGDIFRIKDPSLKGVDDSLGASQLTIEWDSARPYDDPESQKMTGYDLNIHAKAAYEQAVQQVQGQP